MAKIGSIKSDPIKAEAGIWVDYESGIRLKIARMGNRSFQNFVQAKQRPKIRGFRSGTISDLEAEAISIEATARHILLGWENLEDDNGVPIPYSPEKAVEFLNDPALGDLYKFVLLQSSDAEAYKLQAEVEARGN